MDYTLFKPKAQSARGMTLHQYKLSSVSVYYYADRRGEIGSMRSLGPLRASWPNGYQSCMTCSVLDECLSLGVLQENLTLLLVETRIIIRSFLLLCRSHSRSHITSCETVLDSQEVKEVALLFMVCIQRTHGTRAMIKKRT